MNTPTDWVAPLAILAGGLILGLLFVYFFGRRKASGPVIGSDQDLERKDLEFKRDALIAQLRDLEGDTKLTPDQLANERRRLELETAEVLRTLDGYKGARKPSAAAPVEAVDGDEVESGFTMNPAIKGFLWGSLSIALVGALIYFVQRDATPRDQQGGMMAGGQPAAQQGQPNPVVLQLEQAVKNSPDDLALRTNLAQVYLETDNLMGVFEQTKYVLERSPNDSRALTYQALVRVAMGEMPLALDMLQKATKADPKNVDGWLALAWVQTQSNDPAKAEQTIARAVKELPQDQARIEATYKEMKDVHARMVSQPSGPMTASGELPQGHPPIDGSTPPAAAAGAQPTMAPGQAAMAAAGNARPIRLTLDLDPSARSRAASGAALFVIARTAPNTPPIAARRISDAKFPMTIEFSSADSMMGQPLPPSVRLEARLDSDRDAASKNPNDPFAAIDGATAGSAVKLVLK